ncbi:hypothetical protein BC829DRAFT_220791 [Chytridium lagenaria]|nr:hypothetical protein BC829DRAFT_220791 [Chytridium lagenaria]
MTSHHSHYRSPSPVVASTTSLKKPSVNAPPTCTPTRSTVSAVSTVVSTSNSQPSSKAFFSQKKTSPSSSPTVGFDPPVSISLTSQNTMLPLYCSSVTVMSMWPPLSILLGSPLCLKTLRWIKRWKVRVASPTLSTWSWIGYVWRMFKRLSYHSSGLDPWTNVPLIEKSLACSSTLSDDDTQMLLSLAFEYAAFSGSIRVVTYLLNKNVNGSQSFVSACLQGHVDVVGLMLKTG